MRLTSQEADAIREEVHRFDSEAEIYLYGSRADDRARGGDIDLLIISDSLTFQDTLRLRMGILDRIGWQQLDLTVRRRDQLQDAIAAAVLETGQKL